MKKLFCIIVTIVFLLTGCAESTIERVDTSTNSQPNTGASTSGASSNQTATETASTAQASNKNAPEIFQVGDTVKFDNLQITLNGVREVKETEFLSPDNDKYLVIDLTIENVGSESEIVSTLMQMELMDADSFSYSPTIYLDAKGSVDGEIAPGRKQRGEVAFDVPDSDYYEFIFFDPFTTGQAIWRIENNDIVQ